MMSSDALAMLRDRKPDMSINGEAMIRLQSRSLSQLTPCTHIASPQSMCSRGPRGPHEVDARKRPRRGESRPVGDRRGPV